MSASSERASRLRQALQALLADYQHQFENLLPLRQLVKGSVYDLQTRCGKPSCHCASDQGATPHLHRDFLVRARQNSPAHLAARRTPSLPPVG